MYKLIEQFYKENYRVLVKRLNRRAGGVENAEDVLQEAFVRALKYKNSFNPDRQEIGAWFNTIMNNALVVHQRASMLGGVTVPYDENEHEEAYECGAVTNAQVQQVLNTLYKKELKAKNVLHLHFIRGFKMREIGEITDLPVRTIQTIIRRFRFDMIEEFGDDKE